MLKQSSYWTLVLGALALATALPVHAATITAVQVGNWDSDIWDSSDADALPDPGLRPAANDAVIITANVSNLQVTLNSNTGVTLGSYRNSNASNQDALVVQNNAVLGWTGLFETFRNTSGSVDQTSTSSMTGGALNGGASSTFIVGRVGSARNTTATFSQSGGALTTSTLKLTDLASGAGTASGTYNLSGSGVLNVTGNIDPGVNPAGATFNFTGGTLNHHGLLMNLANNGGTLAPGGAGTVGTALLKGTAAGGAASDYSQNSGTLAIDIASELLFDQLSGFGADSGSNNVTLNGLLQINMLSGFTPADGQNFDIITTADIANSSITDSSTLQINGLGSGTFSKSIVSGTGNSDILRLTYSATAVPEPASLALLAIGCLGLLPRRRSRV